jgi:ADP-heptose:LPS heptosyltransferase
MNKTLIKKAGLKESDLIEHEKIDSLLSTTPAMVTAKVMDNFSLQMAGGQKIKLEKGKTVVLPLGLFQNAKRGKNRKIQLKLHKLPFKHYFKRYQGEDLTDKKLLIWRTGGIGDLLFIQPILKRIKELYPTCQITFCTAARNSPILLNYPKGTIDKIGQLPFSLDILKQNDYHITFEGSIERCKEAHNLNCYDIFRNMTKLNFNISDYIPELYPSSTILEDLKNKIPPKTIMIQPRATSIVRSLSINKIVELVRKINDAGFIAGIQDSTLNAHKISYLINNKLSGLKVHNLAVTSKNIAYGVGNAYYCAGGIVTDSAFTHILAALKKPVVGLYGPFRGELRMKYYDTGDWINISDSDWNECNNCPCYIHENTLLRCPYLHKNKHPECMNKFNVDLAIEKFLKLYSKYGDENE